MRPRPRAGGRPYPSARGVCARRPVGPNRNRARLHLMLPERAACASTTQPVGQASRPTRSRSTIVRAWARRSNTPVCERRKNQRCTVLHGGKSSGRCRHAHPVRSTYRMPSKTARSDRRHGRPVLDGAGGSGASTAHSALLRQALTHKIGAGGGRPHRGSWVSVRPSPNTHDARRSPNS